MIINSVISNIQQGDHNGEQSAIYTTTFAGYGLSDNKSSIYPNSYSMGKLQYNGVDLSVNLSTASSWRICVKFLIMQDISGNRGPRIVFNNTQNIYYSPAIELGLSRDYVGVGFNTNGSTSAWAKWLSVSVKYDLNKWYYVVLSWKSGKAGLYLYDNDGILLGSNIIETTNWYNFNFVPELGGSVTGNWWYFAQGKIALNETFIQLDNSFVWGNENNKTAMMGMIT